MDKDHYISLIYKEIKGELSDIELQQLEAFCLESADNRELRDEIQLSWMLSQNAEDTADVAIDVEADLIKVKTKIRHLPDTEKKTVIRKIPLWRRVASVAAVMIPLLIGGIYLFQHLNVAEPTVVQTTEIVKEVTLKDGSTVWLNQNSVLEVDGTFNDANRNVTLSGEAFFDVTENPEIPFVVQIDEVKVSVLGTSFNIKESDFTGNELSVSVVSGSVRVESPNDFVILEQNEKAVFEKEEGRLSKILLSNQNEISWRTGTFIYKSESLADIVAQLEDLFSKTIEIENPAIESCGISIVVNSNDFQTILNNVANAVNCEIEETQRNTYRLVGGLCN